MKHRSVGWISLGLAALVLVALVSPPSGAEGALSGITICLDPGHGGDDPGAVNGGLYESVINLDVSYALKGLLEGDDATVVMTRTGDSYLTNRDRYTFCNEQQTTILVSVHTNSIDNDYWDGSMGLYVDEDDKALAKAIHEATYPMLLEKLPEAERSNFADWGLVRFNSGVLMKSEMPAAMMEPLFMSNAYEASQLGVSIDGENCPDLSCRRGQIAEALHQGILDYFASLGIMHVAALDMWLGTKGPSTFVYTGVTVVDELGNPLLGAVVSLETSQPRGPIVSQTGTTGADGTVTFQLRSKGVGTYTSTVTDVSMSGWDYVPDPDVELSVTLIVPLP